MNQVKTLSPTKIKQYRRTAQRKLQAQLQRRERHRLEALQAIHQAVAKIVPAYQMVKKVYLFGSVIRPGRFKTTSDIDLAIEGADMARCFDLWRDLERLLPNWFLDVRSLEGDDLFAARIRQQGELIYEQPLQNSESRFTS